MYTDMVVVIQRMILIQDEEVVVEIIPTIKGNCLSNKDLINSIFVY